MLVAADIQTIPKLALHDIYLNGQCSTVRAKELSVTSKTHMLIDASLVGSILEITPGGSKVKFELLPSMRVDAQNLVHGGFVFGAADYAAMLAVNHPYVVLHNAETRFRMPCRVGDLLIVTANVIVQDSRKPVVAVSAVNQAGIEVFSGSFSCVVLAKHVLDTTPTLN